MFIAAFPNEVGSFQFKFKFNKVSHFSLIDITGIDRVAKIDYITLLFLGNLTYSWLQRGVHLYLITIMIYFFRYTSLILFNHNLYRVVSLTRLHSFKVNVGQSKIPF